MDHVATMRALLETRERRDLKRLVERVNFAEVIDELEEMRCATHGQEEAVRDRLLRALMREAEPDNVHIPWYDWDFANSSQAEQIAKAPPPEPSNTQPRRRRTSVRGDDTPRMQDFSSSDESARERYPIRITVDVHRPATVSPVTAPTSTTTAITMSQAGRTSVATVSTAGFRHMSTATTYTMPGRPTMNLVPTVLNSLNQQQWVYQYEQLVRSRASQPIPPERSERATPAPAERVQERWCTPAADIDENRKREFRGAESVASRRLDQRERVDYEKSRVTLGARNSDTITPRNHSPRRQESFIRPRSLRNVEEELNRSRRNARNHEIRDLKSKRRGAEEIEKARRSHSQERRRNEPRRRSMRKERSPEIPPRRSRERRDDGEKTRTAKIAETEYEKFEAKEKIVGSISAITEVRTRDNKEFVRERREFRGTCYACHNVGHRAFECSESICFGCRRPGHFARDCPQRAASQRRSADRVVVGLCFHCRAVGHRAGKCPEVICFKRHGNGHVTRDCSSKSQESCQLCDHPGCTVKTCPNCAPMYRRVIEENWRAKPGCDGVIQPREKKHFGVIREAERETKLHRGCFSNSRSL